MVFPAVSHHFWGIDYLLSVLLRHFHRYILPSPIPVFNDDFGKKRVFLWSPHLSCATKGFWGLCPLTFHIFFILFRQWSLVGLHLLVQPLFYRKEINMALVSAVELVFSEIGFYIVLLYYFSQNLRNFSNFTVSKLLLRLNCYIESTDRHSTDSTKSWLI